MNQFQVNVGVLHCAYLGLVKLYDTSPALLYQGSTLAYFRRLPLRRCRTALPSLTTMGGPRPWVSPPVGRPAFTSLERSVCLGARFCILHTKLIACGPPERAFHRLIYQQCITARNYISCIFQRRRFRYGATGAAYHRREFGFVVHSPCTQ